MSVGNVRMYGEDTLQFPSLFDIHSLRHLFSGCAGYIISTKYLGLTSNEGFIIYNILHLMYEIRDWYYTYVTESYKKPPKLWQPRSFINSVSDMFFGVVGYLMMEEYYNKLSKIGILNVHVYMIIYIYISILITRGHPNSESPPG
tara:strand:- start:126 stop:560 length:435 start_codon:yes stop_codon:yes gene_type:complete